MTIRMAVEDFEAVVARALEGLPEIFAEALDNVAVVVEDWPDAEDLEALELEAHELFGLYQGIPLTERDSFYAALPDRIAIYRMPILEACSSRREVLGEIRDTLIHELGHHLGMAEEDMPY